MAAFGFMVNGVLGEADAPAGDLTTVIGIAGSPGVYEGPARIVRNFDDLWGLEDGEILVTPATGESFNSFLHFVGAIVTDHGSFASHAAIMGREMGFPTVVGCVDATRRIATGTRIRVDGNTGTVDWTASPNLLAIESPSERRVALVDVVTAINPAVESLRALSVSQAATTPRNPANSTRSTNRPPPNDHFATRRALITVVSAVVLLVSWWLIPILGCVLTIVAVGYIAGAIRPQRIETYGSSAMSR
jgi:phosphohistidine swiveling domain-containing protein